MKKILIILLLLTALFVFFKYQIPANNNKQKNSLRPVKTISVEQKIYSGTDSSEFNKFEIGMDKTALDLLKESGPVVTKGEKTDAYVVEINGRPADAAKKEFWSFYINGKMSEVGAGSYQLKNGDKIEWKIETY